MIHTHLIYTIMYIIYIYYMVYIIHKNKVSSFLNVLHGGTKQGKAYAAAYALLTRAHVLLTHAVVPYASLTLPNFSTSPQFRLTRSNFYMQELEQ